MERVKRIISAIASGDLKKLDAEKSIASGKKVVISSFLDMLKFFSSVDHRGTLIDREAQIASGEIEVEFVDPIKTALENLLPEKENLQP